MPPLIPKQAVDPGHGLDLSAPSVPPRLPDKKYLDEVVPDRPVYLEGFDGHSSWANSKALQLAGITQANP